MGKRIYQRIKSFTKRWYLWIPQFIWYLLLLERDNIVNLGLSWFGSNYGGKMKDFILLVAPKDLTGWSLLLLVVSIVLILIYDVWDTRKKDGRDKSNALDRPEVPLIEPLQIAQPETKREYYKLRFIPVIELYDDEKRIATLQVESKSNVDVKCIAKLSKVIFSTELDAVRKSKLNIIDKINPIGWFLGWGEESKEDETLDKDGKPSIIRLATVISSLYGDSYGSHMETYASFVFCGSNISNPDWQRGFYKIELDFLRWNSENYIKFSKFSGILKIDHNIVEWIK